MKFPAAPSSTNRNGMASVQLSFAGGRTANFRPATGGARALISRVPPGSVIDGEIVIVTPHGLDFNALQLRLHPAASRVAKLAAESPASFVAFDLLAAGGRDLRDAPQVERRSELERTLAAAKRPVHVTPMTRDA